MSPAELLKLVEACRATLDQATRQLEELEAATRRLVTGQPKNGHPNAIAASTSRLRRGRQLPEVRPVPRDDAVRAMKEHFEDIAIKHHGPDALAELHAAIQNDDDDDALIPF